MPTTIGNVIDYVLQSMGQADVGEDRSAVLVDVVDLITVDLPAEIGGYFLEGTVELPVGYTGSVQENGVYDIPDTMRACKGILSVIDDVSISSPALVSNWFESNTFTDPEFFYSQLNRYGNASTDNGYGQPQYALLYANQIHLRPIPKQTGLPLWFGKLVLFGSVVPDLASATESTVITNPRIVATVRAGACVLYAVRNRSPEIATVWGEIYQARKNELRAMMAAVPSNPIAPREF